MDVVHLSGVGTAFLAFPLRGTAPSTRTTTAGLCVEPMTQPAHRCSYVPLHRSSDGERSRGAERREPGPQNCTWL